MKKANNLFYKRVLKKLQTVLAAWFYSPIQNLLYKSATQAMPNRIYAAGNIKLYTILIVFVGIATACQNVEEPDAKELGGVRMPEQYSKNDSVKQVPLDALLKPVNEFVISAVPVVTVESSTQTIEVPALGTVQYDYRQAGAVSARVSGRIEKLYVRYRYQYIQKGQKVMELYSPELLTSQQNLIFLLQNDADNNSLINAARQRLLLLGMSAAEVNQISKTRKPLYSVSVFSNYSGYVTDAGSLSAPVNATAESALGVTEELGLKEGMYVEAGQTVANIINTNTALVQLNVFADQQGLIHVGDAVRLKAETSPVSIQSQIDYIEPFYGGATGTLSARAYINNSKAQIPIGSQVQATIFTKAQNANWLPATAVLNLGLSDIVFVKEGTGYRAKKVTTGLQQEGRIQIISGVNVADSVVANAQYLTENESFIQVKD